MTDAKPLIIGVNVNEATMRDATPHVPWTPQEIADVAADCEAAGASLMHFHGRTTDGGVDHSAETYAEIVRRVKGTSNLLLAPSMANVPGHDVDQRLANIAPNQDDPATSVELVPIDMGSATMDLFDPVRAEYVTDDRVFVNDTRSLVELMTRAPTLGLTPYLASFTLGWTRAIVAHHAAGRLRTPLAVVLVLGGDEFVAAHPPTPSAIQAHLDVLPPDLDVEWLVSCYRGDLLRVAEHVVSAGGHLVIGAGDHPYSELGCPSTAELVERVAALGRRLGRRPASPDDARRMLGVRQHARR